MHRRVRGVLGVGLMLVCSIVAAQEKRGDGSVYDKYPLVKPIAGEEQEDFEKMRGIPSKLPGNSSGERFHSGMPALIRATNSVWRRFASRKFWRLGIHRKTSL